MITPAFGLTATERVLPNLALDFTTATLDPRVTFTRTGNTATVVNSSGFIAPINADLPRFDYDPVTLVCKGLLIEESRTNGVTYSEQINSTNFLNLNVTYNAVGAITAPDNTGSGSLFYETSASGNHVVYQSFTSVAGTTYTGSVYAKYAGRQWIYVAGHSGAIGVFFDIVNGVVGNSVGGATGTISNAGNGWFRCTATALSPTASTFYTQVMLATANGAAAPSYPGDVTKGVYLWGMQREVGAFATSYIPTVASQVTRTADVATMTGTNFSDWYNATEGAFSSQATSYTTNSNQDLLTAYLNTTNYMRGWFAGVPTTAARFTMVTSGAAVMDGNLSATGLTRRICFSYKTDNTYATANNSGSLLDTSCALPLNTTLNIGSNQSGSVTFNGWVKNVFYWPQRLTNNETLTFSKVA